MGEATKSKMTCGDCGTSVRVLRLQWLDTFPEGSRWYPEGSRWYDDHVCLGCGRYASQPSAMLGADSLREYRRKYGRVIAPRSRTWLARPAMVRGAGKQRSLGKQNA